MKKLSFDSLRAFLAATIFAGGVIFSASSLFADAFSWLNVNGQNMVSSVKQQNGGTCWAFSSTATAETRYKITRNDSVFEVDGSEQSMEWDAQNYGTGNGGDDWGGWGDGGVFYSVVHGLVSETECPIDWNNPGTWDAPGAGSPWPLATGWQNRRIVGGNTAQNNDERQTAKGATQIVVTRDNIKAMLKQYGPMMTAVNGIEMYSSVASLSNYIGVTPGVDHAVELVGYQDDVSLPTGGYWIIKNSWGTGFGDAGIGYVPYGNLEFHNDLVAINTPMYYTGAMYHVAVAGTNGTDYYGTAATNTWKGTTNGTWDTSAGTINNWQNNSTGTAFQWLNQELQANFDSTGTNKAITVKGTVIAHGLTVSTTGYSFAPYDSSSALTITGGGITTSNSITLSTPVFIGGPQTWNVASGQTITVSGALHTVISDLTISGAGNVTISSLINGGGAINADGPGTTHGTAKPGGIIKSNTGTLTLTGASNFGGDVTVNTGTLTIRPATTATYSGAFFGSGGLSINPTGTGTISIGGGNSNFTGPIAIGTTATLQFVPATTDTNGKFGGIISGTSRPVIQNGVGTTTLTGVNTYTGSTTIKLGALQANSGTGLPASSMLILNGGVLQSNGAATFTRTLSSTAGSNRFYWSTGGGFSAGSTGTMNVRINNGTGTISFGTTAGSNILGSLYLSSTTAAAITTFENGLNLNGGFRTIRVVDNPNSTGDYAIVSGVISNSTGGGLLKEGDGLLALSANNTYSVSTRINDGSLAADTGAGLPTSSALTLNGGTFMPLTSATFTRSMGTGSGQVSWDTMGGGFTANGVPLTVNIGNNNTPLVWGTTVGTNLLGTLKLSSKFASSYVLLTNPLNLVGGARTIEVADNPNTTADYAALTGVISGSGGSLTKTGYGGLAIAGSAANTYTGATNITNGWVALQKSSGVAIPGALNISCSAPATTTLAQTLVIVDSANPQLSASTVVSFQGEVNRYPYLLLNGHDTTVAGISDASYCGVVENTETSSVTNCTLTVDSSANYTFNGYLRDNGGGSGTLGIVKNGTGTMQLEGPHIYHTGGTTVSGGKLLLKDTYNATFAYTNITDNATLEFNATNTAFTYAGVISGTGSVIKSGPNLLYLGGSASNTYTGGTTVNQGILVLNNSSGYSIPGNLTIDSSGIVVVYAANQIPSTTNVTFTGTGTPELLLYGNNVTVASISAASAGRIGNTSGAAVLTNGHLTVNNSTDNIFNGVIFDNDGGTDTLALTKSGAGILWLGGTAANTYTGGTTVNQGILALNKTTGYAVPGDLTIDGTGIVCVIGANQLPATSNLTFTGSGNRDFLIYGNTVTVASISSTTGGKIGNTDGAVGPGNGQLIVNNTSNCSYNGAIFDNYSGSGLFALTKNGAGTLTLNGNTANDFTGGLTINAGTVDFENTENDVAHPYTVNAGGHLVLNGVQLAAAASAMSLIAASETEDYANAVPDTNNGTMSIVGSTYFNARNLVGTGTLKVQDDAVVYAHSLVQDTLVIGGTSSLAPAVAVPEPGTMILLSLGVMALAGVGIGRKNRG
jgi:autotransporter-associated beta strand protein